MSLQGKRVLVTGGARGIGLATAKLFEAEGADVAIWALHPESIEEVRPQFRRPIVGQALDIGDFDAVRQAYRTLREELGPVDILVNNAGYTLTTRFLEEDPAYWERVVSTNLWGVVYTTQTVLPDMLEAGSGSIINVVSDAGRVGMQGEAMYAASKGGVMAFSKSIAQEFAKRGVRVNCVSPGPTRTRILEENSEHGDAGKLIERMVRRIPMRRIAEPEEVAQTIVFFASDASSHITGQVLSVSGGLTMV
ncbi:SDR family oxidoreductase [Alicyclobacillus cycloheptanicus]|uniref:2-hydroxycyclohexanecarboxyl-CoA dehydrogenase n=1 Tax=Alicyclobacillus cycloheptanicus TaxID=1457 RepID=A0ABT9XL48_9BACL|nr:SDR family NAD(P)-dependent oxidoreductase [Alicyclobacillus cycloheptanicus]MDQ0191031.1 2-hydroxycyclohexanecarboxyl-CoA dehydrogenase [Alicyclobacillus cycloheptanicus]WDM00922.1 SDR family oxidoreductase [Alicyclobacillus cycloheptanicus]